MHSFSEQCLDMARSMLAHNLDSIQPDGTILPANGEASRPDEPGLPPAYASAGASGPGATCVASGGEGGLPLRIRGASCHTLVLGPQQRQTLPDAPRLHVFVVTGTVHLDSHLLQAGDAARLVHEGGRAVRAEGTAHLLVWALP